MNAMFRCGFRFLPLALALFLAGCATQKVDWSARVGNYTLDQAIVDFGPPDKQAKLQDGTVVAEWLTRRGYIYSTPGVSPGWGDPFYPGSINSTPDFYLRLTFDPAGKLAAWKKFAK